MEIVRIALIVLVVAAQAAAHADQWAFPAERKVDEFDFGKTKIVRVVDATENRMYPEYSVDIYTDGKLEGRYRNVSFDDIAASEDNSVFVGISNSGIPGTAIVIFDSRARLLALVDHYPRSDQLEYCQRSVSIVRVWYDSEEPNLHFVGADTGNIEVNNCRGEVVNVYELAIGEKP